MRRKATMYVRSLVLLSWLGGSLLGCGGSQPLPDGDPLLALEYSFGNQIFGSTVSIMRDGSIGHSERSCCPPVITPRAEAALTATALAELLARIEDVSRGEVETVPYTAADGALYGELYVHTASVKKALIRQYILGEERRNLSPAVSALVSLANQYAQNDMPQ